MLHKWQEKTQFKSIPTSLHHSWLQKGLILNPNSTSFMHGAYSGLDSLGWDRNQLESGCNTLDPSATSLQLMKIQERKNLLHCKINTWTRVQHLYMPEVSAHHDRTNCEASDSTAPTEPYDTPLFLPSSLPCLTVTQSLRDMSSGSERPNAMRRSKSFRLIYV